MRESRKPPSLVLTYSGLACPEVLILMRTSECFSVNLRTRRRSIYGLNCSARGTSREGCATIR
jgi:hypothetical protein